jgi:hypothetical protein
LLGKADGGPTKVAVHGPILVDFLLCDVAGWAIRFSFPGTTYIFESGFISIHRTSIPSSQHNMFVVLKKIKKHDMIVLWLTV